MCCHPSLSAPSQIALTLRAVGGLSTREIATAFLVPEATMAQRISRAKQTIRDAGATFTMPPARELQARTAVVQRVLYLIFNEGYTATSGEQVNRTDLTAEAVRLTRDLHRLSSGDNETAGLLALMLLTEARRPARSTPSGDLVPLADQDRALWNQVLINEGTALATDALTTGPAGPYGLQAAIAAVHSEAQRPQDTDWPQVLALYRVLDQVAPGPMVTLNMAVAVGMVEGPEAGLEFLAPLESDRRVADHHLLYAVKGHLLDRAGQPEAASTAFESAGRRTASMPEKRFLAGRAAELARRALEG
jgi:predicted RNA polymerase sigma factor